MLTTDGRLTAFVIEEQLYRKGTKLSWLHLVHNLAALHQRNWNHTESSSVLSTINFFG